LAHNQVFNELITTISSDKHIGLVGGDPKPLPATTFTEKAVNLTLEAYIPLRDSYKGGHNVLSATGRLMALKKELAQVITVPKDTISNDGFTYFSCISKGYLYRHAPKASAYFRSPKNLKDHLSQSTRFAATPLFMKRYFPPDLVDKSYELPKMALRLNMFKQFIKHPILATYILLINKYCHLKSIRDQQKINAIWDIVYTTKTLQ
jgi:cellulose synthase/poly-beta-1,6-N-acetylglucosamine synthase-like glycosyltransferase